MVLFVCSVFKVLITLSKHFQNFIQLQANHNRNQKTYHGITILYFLFTTLNKTLITIIMAHHFNSCVP